jgi:hypothetical protein
MVLPQESLRRSISVSSESPSERITSPVDIRWFGAIGDGSTDCSAAIAGAIAALPSDGGEVYVPPGLFLTDPIVLPSYPKKVRFIGAGSYATTLTPTGANQPLIIAATPITNFVCPPHIVGGFSVKAHASGSTGPAIDMRGISFSKFYDIGYKSNGAGKFDSLFFMSDVARAADAWAPAQSFGSCYVNEIEDVVIRNQLGPNYVIRSDNTAQAHTLRRISVSSINTGMAYGIWLDGRSTNWNIENSHFEGLSNCTAIVPTAGTKISGCYFEDTAATSMVYLDGRGSFGVGCPLVNVVDCNFNGPNLATAILFPNTSGARAMGWTFTNCKGVLADITWQNARNVAINIGSIHQNLAIGKLYGGIMPLQVDPPGFQAPVKIPNSATGLIAGSYEYDVTSINNVGESTKTIYSVVVSGGEAPCQILLPYLPAEGATAYRIYGRTAGSKLLMKAIYPQNADGSALFTDDGTITPSGASAPARNSTADISGLYWMIFKVLKSNENSIYLPPGDTTPSVAERSFWNSEQNDTLTNFDDGAEGQFLIIRNRAGSVTIQHNANIKLRGSIDYTMGGNGVIAFFKYPEYWIEIFRNEIP